jgi:hypothetical protein
MIPTASFYNAAATLTCGRRTEIILNDILDLKFSAWDYKCVTGSCAVCKDRFIAAEVNCSWREYDYVPKLKKKETLNNEGNIANGPRAGKKPTKSRELVVKEGTRLQFTESAQKCWKVFASHNYEAR